MKERKKTWREENREKEEKICEGKGKQMKGRERKKIKVREVEREAAGRFNPFLPFPILHLSSLLSHVICRVLAA